MSDTTPLHKYQLWRSAWVDMEGNTVHPLLLKESEDVLGLFYYAQKQQLNAEAHYVVRLLGPSVGDKWTWDPSYGQQYLNESVVFLDIRRQAFNNSEPAMNAENIFDNCHTSWKKAYVKFKNDLLKIRKRNVDASILMDLHVESYGSRSPLSHIASVSHIQDGVYSIRPWDSSLLSAIETSISQYDPSLIVRRESLKIIVTALPSNTSEQAKAASEEFLQRMNEVAKEARTAMELLELTGEVKNANKTMLNILGEVWKSQALDHMEQCDI